MEFEWDQNDRYRSNGGKGPLTARILCVARGVAQMERWRGAEGEGRSQRFQLPVSYLKSPRCGWRKSDT